jgi:hypothetical protein
MARGKASIGIRSIACIKPGFISNPRGKAKSVVLTDEGLQRAEQLQQILFGK